MTPERRAKYEKIVNNRRFDITIILENVNDPHNIAAVLRSADAVGIAEVYTINTRPVYKKGVGDRSSSSANKWVKVINFESVEACVKVVKLKYKNLYCTHLNEESVSIYDVNLTESVALVFGNEKDGVSPALRNYCTGNFIIPQIGMISSLNISVACAVSIYEAFRQRQTTDYSNLFINEKLSLLENWTSINN
jgi:tRNA (guanosine-2'-O-)-methyltransferase